jgi:hypothetical protein
MISKAAGIYFCSSERKSWFDSGPGNVTAGDHALAATVGGISSPAVMVSVSH